MTGLLDFKEACDALKISKETLYRWTSSRKISHRRLGRKIYFTQSDLTEYIIKSKVEAEDGNKTKTRSSKQNSGKGRSKAKRA